MPTQQDTLLAQIGHMEGRTITRQLAQQCRQLSNAPVMTEVQVVIEQIKSQLLIMFLRDLGGTKKYTIEDIDECPSDYNFMLRQIKYHGKQALEFTLKEK